MEETPGRNPPYNLLRMSFSSYHEAVTYWSANAGMLTQIWAWHEALGDRKALLKLPGICDICEKQTDYTATPVKTPKDDQFSYRVSWWSDMMCFCGLPTMERSVLRILLDTGATSDQIYHVGHHSRFRLCLSDRLPNVTSSQYEAGKRPGEVENGIRYEDITGLSFADETFDCLVCMEILEHLPNYKLALHEIMRVLKPGGRALLTFPWLGGEYYEHRVRAEMLPDGTINHLLTPEYHGDPARHEGILSFRDFGWTILDELREVGFDRVEAQYIFGPLHGYMELQTPVVVAWR